MGSWCTSAKRIDTLCVKSGALKTQNFSRSAFFASVPNVADRPRVVLQNTQDWTFGHPIELLPSDVRVP